MKTPRTSKLPPFYTQALGSFPRPKVVLDLLERRRDFAPERFDQIMDDLVRFVIRTEGLTGLDVVSDGHWRGANYVGEFLRRTGGFELVPDTHEKEAKPREVVVRRMSPTGSVYKADADFLVNNTARHTKISIPSPAGIAIRHWHPDHSSGSYPTRMHFMEHLMALLSAEVHALAAAGIDIIQVNDSSLVWLCGEAPLPPEWTTSDWDRDMQLTQTLAAINRLFDTAEGKAEIHLHCCLGNVGAGRTGAANFKPLFQRIKELRIDRLNVSLVGPGAAKIEDLALLPAHIDAALGVLDLAFAHPQTADEIRSVINAAAAILPPSRISLNPACRCGVPSPDSMLLDETYDRLKLLTDVAKSLRAKHT